MVIQLTDMDQDDQVSVDSYREPTGVVIVDPSGWSASCPQRNISLSGSGIPDDLPSSVSWVANLDYSEVRAVRKSQTNSGVKLRSGDWFRPDLQEMLEDWGSEKYGKSHKSEMLSTLSNRIIRLSYEAIRSFLDTTPSREASVFAGVEKSMSLAGGFRVAMGPRMEKLSTSDRMVMSRVSHALKYGAFNLRESAQDNGDILVRLRAPRLLYAQSVLSRRVPANGKWQKAKVNEDIMTREILDGLLALNRPVLVSCRATPSAAIENDFMKSWIIPKDGNFVRMSYTLEEVIEMFDHFQFSELNILVGPGWTDSIASSMISSLIDVCGSEEFAHSCWSAGVVAENILLGSMRPPRTHNSEGSATAESVWIAAYDRIESLPYVRTMEKVGLPVSGAYAGGLRFKSPDDPEMISTLLNSGWEAGLHAQMSTVRDLKEQGFEVVAESDVYGGDHRTLLFSLLAQGARQRVLWEIDAISEKKISERAEVFAQMTS